MGSDQQLPNNCYKEILIFTSVLLQLENFFVTERYVMDYFSGRKTVKITTMPQVSIGLPVYNGEKYLSEALDSIINQTFKDFELIISDNGSKDATGDICLEYASIDSRIRYYKNEENLGAAWNYNKVFHMAESVFFKWMACDDIIAPLFLERCVENLTQKQDVVLCYPWTVDIDGYGNRIGRYHDKCNLYDQNSCDRFRKYVLRFNRRFNPVFGLIRTSVLKSTSLIGNYNSSDQVLLAHLALLGKFHEIPEELFFRRLHSGMSMKANKNVREVENWFDPNKKKCKAIWPITRTYLGYIKCLMQVNIGVTEQIVCLKAIARKMWRTKKRIKNELVSAAKNIMKYH